MELAARILVGFLSSGGWESASRVYTYCNINTGEMVKLLKFACYNDNAVTVILLQMQQIFTL